MKRVVAGLSVVLLGLLLAGCANGNQSGAVASTSAPASGEPAAMPPGEPARPAATPLLPSIKPTEPAAEAAKKLATAAKELSTAAKKAKVTFVMPNLVGKNLQKAQDALQSRGSYLLDEQDATGAGRIQVIDTDWKVCRQKPKPGAKVLIVTIVQLASVKLQESCP
jgi:hypothetical protein